MKKLFLIFSFFVSITACTDRNSETNQRDFCEVQRQFVENIDNKTGELIYLNDKNRYAIKYYPDSPTIDEVIFLILCEKPDNIELNSSVDFSCKTWKFNDDEDYNPAIGGTQFYFASNLNIKKV